MYILILLHSVLPLDLSLQKFIYYLGHQNMQTIDVFLLPGLCKKTIISLSLGFCFLFFFCFNYLRALPCIGIAVLSLEVFTHT